MRLIVWPLILHAIRFFVVLAQAAQHVDGIEHTLGGGRGAQFEHVQELRRIAAQRGVTLADMVQEIKIGRPRQRLRLGDAGGEGADLLPEVDEIIAQSTLPPDIEVSFSISFFTRSKSSVSMPARRGSD